MGLGVALEELLSSRNVIDWLRHVSLGSVTRRFAAASVLLAVAAAIAPARDYFRDWRQYQREYLRLVHGRPDAAQLESRSPKGIQQIWIPELQVVDRCTTCHVALKETNIADISLQPFRKHPAMPHSLTEFGCVVCHRGQGPATSANEAHHATEAWEEPLLPAKYMEASCGQCHFAPLRGTPVLNEGRRLLERKGCVNCHTIKLADGSVMQPTDDPPPLNHIAEKTTREWIFAFVKNPQAYAATASMPNFAFTDDDARDVSAFLIAQSTPSGYGPKLAAKQAKPASVDANALAEGTSLYGQSFCASCHASQNAAGNLVGGDLGPELTCIGSKTKPEWLEEWIRDPNGYDADSKMPHYRFNDKQVGVLSNYLLSKTDSDLLANVKLGPATQAQIDHGRSLVVEYGCASCHKIEGIKKPDNFAPDLSREGSKPFAQLTFPQGVNHALPDYISSKIREPRSFGPKLKMPKYTLTAAELDSLSTAVLSLTDRANSFPSKLRIPSRRESQYQPAGRAGRLISDLRCFSCHMMNGRGGNMATDLSWEGSSVQRPWLVDFLKNPNTLRPALIRRMPKFNLADAEINTLTDYMLTVYQLPSIDPDTIPGGSLTPQLVEQGRQLYYAKYGCQACHIIDPKQDKGYIGPVLSQVGLRLTPAWTFRWFKDPESLRPGSQEPNQHMTDEDARALTAYMMSLKTRAKAEAK
jgi:mono/diheme cytochrome c family protein